MVAAAKSWVKQAARFKKRVCMAQGKSCMPKKVKAAMKTILAAKTKFGKAVNHMSRKCSKSAKRKIVKKVGKAQIATKKAKMALRIAVRRAHAKVKRNLAAAKAAVKNATTAGQKLNAVKLIKKQTNKLIALSILKSDPSHAERQKKLKVGLSSAKNVSKLLPCMQALGMPGTKNNSVHQARLSAKKSLKRVKQKYRRSIRSMKLRIGRATQKAGTCKSSSGTGRAVQHAKNLGKQLKALKAQKKKAMHKANKAGAKGIASAKNVRTVPQVMGFKKQKNGKKLMHKVKGQVAHALLSVETVAKKAVKGAQLKVKKAQKMVKSAKTKKQKARAAKNLKAAMATLKTAAIVGQSQMKGVLHKSKKSLAKAKTLRKTVVSKTKVALKPGDRVAVHLPCKTKTTKK